MVVRCLTAAPDWHPLHFRNTTRKRGLCLSSSSRNCETGPDEQTWVLHPSLTKDGCQADETNRRVWIWIRGLGQDLPRPLKLRVRQEHFDHKRKWILGEQSPQMPTLCAWKWKDFYPINICWPICLALCWALGWRQGMTASSLNSTAVTANKHNEPVKYSLLDCEEG